MKNVSLKRNLIMNYIRTIMGVIFPLITFPYASRILSADGIGKVNFVASIIVYLQLIASLGISTYAIREGTKVRHDKKKLSVFASEIIIINICATIVSYIIMFAIVCIPQFEPYRNIILLYSLILLFGVFSVDWIYSIFEDFTYITLRATFFQVVSLVLLLVLVRDSNDVIEYVLVTVISSAGSSIFNFIHSRKYIHWFPRDIQYTFGKHLKPIFIIFGTTIATKVYLNMDTIMIGIFHSDSNVGLYTAAIKFNAVLSSIITAISGVMLPRLSYYIGQNSKNQFKDLVRKSLQYLLFSTIPTILGLFFVTEDVIILFCGKDFAAASITMKIILPNLFCSILNGFIAYQIFTPCKKEKWALIATISGAVTNFCMNLVLIPIWKQNGAAVATVITEIVVFVVCYQYSKKLIDIQSVFRETWKYIVSGLSFLVVYWLLRFFDVNNHIIKVLIEVVLGAAIYIFILFQLKCKFLCEVIADLKIKKV